MARPSVVLPEPLSPTTPRVSPARSAIEARLTALTWPTVRRRKPRLDREPDLERVGLEHGRGVGWDRVGAAGGLGGEQHPGVGVLGGGEERAGRAGLDDAAGLHHRDAVGDAADDAEIVGDEEHRHALGLLDVGEERQDLGLDGDVESGGRLVGDQHVGAVGERHRDHHPLALAAGELVGVGAHPGFGVAEADLAEKFEDAGAGLGADEALVQREALADLPLDGVQRVEAGHRLLEDEADVVAAHVAQGAGVGGEHLLAAVTDRAGDVGVLRQKADGGERGDRLARAAFADEGEGLARVELEADAAHGLAALAALHEGDAEVADVEQRLGERELAGVLHRRSRSCRWADVAERGVTGRSFWGRRRRGRPRR